MKNAKIAIIALTLGLINFFYGCADDDGNNNFETDMRIEMTDAPIDNTNISGVFVTVAAIKIDGEEYQGFSGPKTINVYALQNGQTEVLGMGKVNANAYSQLTLVLDADTDAQGNAPGCYVMTVNGTKDNLYASASGTQEIVISKAFTAASESSNQVVLDFDLRKTITSQASGGSTDYEFESNATLASSIRLVKRNECGNVQGSLSGSMQAGTKTVVYAYKKGTYNANSQANATAEFSGAVTSCIADGSGNYTLAFLEEGEYDIVCASYEDSDNDGQFELRGTLSIDILLGIDTSPVTVDAESNTSLNISIAGLLPL